MRRLLDSEMKEILQALCHTGKGTIWVTVGNTFYHIEKGKEQDHLIGKVEQTLQKSTRITKNVIQDREHMTSLQISEYMGNIETKRWKPQLDDKYFL